MWRNSWGEEFDNEDEAVKKTLEKMSEESLLDGLERQITLSALIRWAYEKHYQDFHEDFSDAFSNAEADFLYNEIWEEEG